MIRSVQFKLKFTLILLLVSILPSLKKCTNVWCAINLFIILTAHIDRIKFILLCFIYINSIQYCLIQIIECIKKDLRFYIHQTGRKIANVV